MKHALLLALFLLASAPALAVHPDEVLQDTALEARARAITKQLRCLVCQGEDIDESHAPLAADLRRIVRERLVKGDTDEEAIAYLQKRYGDYVLMNPPLSLKTLMLWAAPLLALAGGLSVAILFIRRQSREGG